MPDQKYRVVCFDLDGTLLPMDLDKFMKKYFHTLGCYVARLGVPQQIFSAGMRAGIGAMASHRDNRSNSEVFWENFFMHVDRNALDWQKELATFYESDFGDIGKDMTPNPAAASAICTLVDYGYPLILTTMPMFPLRAVWWRLEWAGVDPSVFKRITTYTNSTSTKPNRQYFVENLAAAGVKGEEVLMVGNNTEEDLAFMDLGADAFLVTDCLLNPINFDINRVRNGSLASLAQWVETLPVCTHPATGIQTGLISADERRRALCANGKEPLFAVEGAPDVADVVDDAVADVDDVVDDVVDDAVDDAVNGAVDDVRGALAKE